MLSEIRQRENEYCIFSFILGVKLMKIESRRWLTEAEGGEVGEILRCWSKGPNIQLYNG